MDELNILDGRHWKYIDCHNSAFRAGFFRGVLRPASGAGTDINATTRQQMIECFKGLPEEELEAILGKNAVELYDLDGAACRALADKIGPEKALFA